MSEGTVDHPFGKAISVLKFSDTKQVIVDNEEIDKIFSHPEIQDRKVVILSLIGAFRGGKSFFLDYCLRFLYAHFSSINNPWEVNHFTFEKDNNWMGSSHEPLKGFSWRSATKRDTTGIIFWSDVFLHTIDSTGEKIAIFVMDTQGLFDSDSTPTDNARIFALGTLLSSVQVLNLLNRAQEDQLQYLQFATEFSQFAAENKQENDEKPFQNLTFLIRDWNNDDEYSYGTVGGKEYIKEILTTKVCQNQELQSVRESIFNCFEKIECCLLPYPGKVVAGRKIYDGRWSEMDEEFRVELKRFIECLLLPENMILKKINSREIKGREMKQCSQNYFNLFKSNQIPRTSSIYEFTVESHMNNLMKRCVDDYKLTVYRNADIINEQNVPIVHEKCKTKALELYNKEKKMGAIEHEEKFSSKLKEEIDKIFIYFSGQSEQKSKEIEIEVLRQQAALAWEQQQRQEAEEARRQAEIRLRNLEERQSQMEAAEYERQRMMFEARLYAERLRLQEYELRIKEEESFRRMLILAAGVTALVGATFATGGVAAGLGAVIDASAAITNAASSIEGAVIAVRGTISAIHACYIQ